MTELLNQQLAEEAFFAILNSNSNLIKYISEGYLNDLKEIHFYQDERNRSLQCIVPSLVGNKWFYKIHSNTYWEVNIIKTTTGLLNAGFTKINIDFFYKTKELINFI